MMKETVNLKNGQPDILCVRKMPQSQQVYNCTWKMYFKKEQFMFMSPVNVCM